MKRIYICHPYAGGEGPKRNMKRLRELMKGELENMVGIKELERPLLFVPHFAFSEITVDPMGKEMRDWAMAMCLEMVRLCDEVWVFPFSDGNISMGMRQEIDLAIRHSIKVIWRMV